MKKRLLKYREYLERIKSNPSLLNEFDLNEMNVQILFFQHERLVHLLVTLFVALLTVLGFLYFAVFPSVALLCLDVVFLVLLIPYLKHYYFLENQVQRLYDDYDQINALKKKLGV